MCLTRLEFSSKSCQVKRSEWAITFRVSLSFWHIRKSRENWSLIWYHNSSKQCRQRRLGPKFLLWVRSYSPSMYSRDLCRMLVSFRLFVLSLLKLHYRQLWSVLSQRPLSWSDLIGQQVLFPLQVVLVLATLQISSMRHQDGQAAPKECPRFVCL